MNKHLSLALVALSEKQLAGKLLVDFLTTMWTETPPIEQCRDRGSVMTMNVGSAVCGVTLVDRPIPWTQLAGPCEAAWYWPAATETMRSHRAHLLVTLLDETTDAVDRCLRLTQITAAAAATAPSLGVCWGGASLVHEPGPFLELAQEMTRDLLPLNLWIDFRIESQEDGRWRLYTTGLEELGFHEVEVCDYEGDIQRLRDTVYNVAHYQIDATSKIKDGDTIGLSDTEQLTARRTDSLLDADKEVIRLEFGD